MRKYLLSENGNFYKANMHCHSILSDGHKTPEEIKEIYKKKGYSIVAYTDHDLFVTHNDLTDSDFLALNGFEYEVNEPGEKEFGYANVKTCHICVVAMEPETEITPCYHREKYFYHNAVNYRHLAKFDESLPDYEREYSGENISEAIKTFREKGFFVTYNHPTWSRERYPEYMSYKGMHAVEIFNGGCNNAGYDDFNPRVYEDILSSGQRIYCIGGDDSHLRQPENSRRFDAGHAWTMIKADKLEYKDIADALLKGNFYASEGPEIYALWIEDGKIHIECSEADRIAITYEKRKANIAYNDDYSPITSADFELFDLGYFRLTVIDKQGKRACTNAYFPD